MNTSCRNSGTNGVAAASMNSAFATHSYIHIFDAIATNVMCSESRAQFVPPVGNILLA